MSYTVRIYRCGLLLALILLGMGRAGAQALDYALDQNTLTGVQGSTVSFVARLSNTDAAHQLSLDSNSVNFSYAGADLTFVDNFAATPLTLDVQGSADDAWTGVLFRVQIGAATPPADYSGSYELTYSDVTTGISSSHSQNFTVTVTAAPSATTPEPGTLALSSGLLCAVFAAGGRRLQKHRRVRP